MADSIEGGHDSLSESWRELESLEVARESLVAARIEYVLSWRERDNLSAANETYLDAATAVLDGFTFTAGASQASQAKGFLVAETRGRLEPVEALLSSDRKKASLMVARGVSAMLAASLVADMPGGSLMQSAIAALGFGEVVHGISRCKDSAVRFEYEFLDEPGVDESSINDIIADQLEHEGILLGICIRPQLRAERTLRNVGALGGLALSGIIRTII